MAAAGIRRCDCRFWGNQHGHGYTFCERHGAWMEHIARAKGITVQEAFDEAIRNYVDVLSALGKGAS